MHQDTSGLRKQAGNRRACYLNGHGPFVGKYQWVDAYLNTSGRQTLSTNGITDKSLGLLDVLPHRLRIWQNHVSGMVKLNVTLIAFP